MSFGDTRQGDRAGIQADPGPKWDETLRTIGLGLEALECSLLEIKQECQRLEEAGMYPCVPTESWETRNGGEVEYLRMVFGRDRPHGWPRKKYIGCKPEAIAEARRLVANRQRWEELTRAARHLKRFLQEMQINLRHVVWKVEGYQVPDLGTAAASQDAGGVPNAEKGDSRCTE